MNKLTYLCFIVLFTSTVTKASPIFEQATEAYVSNEIQRVRLDFTMPNGYVRHLLLGFTPNNAATDGIDYGYDALNPDNFPDDLNWMIEGQRYVIQGVGAFESTKQYPLGMFITNPGNISISLDTLENFETEIEVYLFDALNNTYTLLNDVDFEENVSEGIHLDRYYIAFKNDKDAFNGPSHQLSILENEIPETSILFLNQTKEIYISSKQNISKLEVFNLLGKRILNQEDIHTKTIRLQTHFTSENYGIVRVHSTQGVSHKKLLLK